MANPLDRKKMVEEIYHSIGHTYPDIRQFSDGRKILQRRLDIQKILNRLPHSHQRRKTRREKQLQRESLLLKYKYMLYTDSPDLPVKNLVTTRFLVESTDLILDGDDEEQERETPAQIDRFKRCQTIALIHLIHLKSTDDEFMAFYRKAMNIE